jgi:hypothetical protein
MCLKTNASQTQQTPPTSYSTVTASSTTPTTTMAVAQTTPTQQATANPPQIKPRRRFSSLAIRGALWATFLVPLVVVGTQLPRTAFESRPDVRLLLPVAYGQTASSVVYSPDGKLVALVDAKLDFPQQRGPRRVGVTFWDPVTRRRVGKRTEFPGMPQKIAFSADSRELILMSSLAIRSVNVGTGAIRPLEWNSVRGVDFGGQHSPYFTGDTQTIVAFSRKADLGVLVEPLNDGQLTKRVRLQVKRRGMFDPLWTVTLTSVGTLIFSPDGKYLLVSVKEAMGENLVCLDVRSGDTIWTRPLVPPELARARMSFPQQAPVFAISPDSQRVVLRLNSGIRVLRLSDAAMVTHLSRPPAMRERVRPNPLSEMLAEGALSFSPDGKTLAERLPEGVYLWNLAGVP